MQTLNTLSITELKKKLSGSAIGIQIGPFNISIQTNHLVLAQPIHSLYGKYRLLDEDEFVDFNIKLLKPYGIRRFIKPQIYFYLDDFTPFKPLPLSESFAFLEWGMNWCISAHLNNYFMIHSAVLAKDDKVVIIPGEPGSGKSTLCAGLCGEGWQLLSDEIALVDKNSGLIWPLGRPISLKNQSIEIIQNEYPDLTLGNICNTHVKGKIGHFNVPDFSLNKLNQPLQPKLIVFPKYKVNTEFVSEKLLQANAALKVIQNSFNYSILAHEGFEVLSKLINNTESYEIYYDNLKDPIQFISEKIC